MVKPRLLDLCCGSGGWTKGFLKAGFTCHGVDIADHGYPGKLHQCDLRDFQSSKSYDVITASPPCTELSTAKHYAYGTSIDRDALDLIYQCYRIIHEVKPRFYILENVPGIARFLGPPRDIIRYGLNPGSKRAYLYGDYPALGMLPAMINHRHDNYGSGDPRRSEIPLPLACHVAERCLSAAI